MVKVRVEGPSFDKNFTFLIIQAPLEEPMNRHTRDDP